MFIFAMFATAVVVGFVYGLVTDITNGGGLGEEAAENYTTTSDTTTTTSNVSTKANLTPNGETIIGLRDASLIKNSSELTTTAFDTTTYGDRAILKLTNETVYTATLTGLSIRGKVVLQQSGKNGYVWEYSDYDAIEKEGESFVEVSNDYIFDPVQAKSIGDFVWKELKPHKLYTLQLIGCHYEYEIGDIWHVTLEYTLNNGTMENIDTDVEIMGSSMSRSVGELGITTLNLRVPSSAWELTLAKNAKLVGAGTSKRLNNRSNVVTVAASNWTGQADYYCDGTGDNVEIQAAIDYVYLLGGGEVVLTSGLFVCANTILILKSGVVLRGQGNSSILAQGYIQWQSASTVNASVTSFSMSTVEPTASFFIDGYGVGSAANIFIYDTSSFSGGISLFYRLANVVSCGVNNSGAYFGSITAFSNCNTVSNCFVYNCSGFTGYSYCKNITSSYFAGSTSIVRAGGIVGFGGCENITSCSVYDTTISGTGIVRPFFSCTRVVACSATNNTSSGGSSYGFDSCKYVHQCKSSGHTTNYQNSYADLNANPCADTAAGGYNS